MKMFKKILAGVLLAAMALTLMTGCGEASKREKVFKTLQTALGSDIKIEQDADLQKQAEKFGKAIADGKNVKITEAGQAYAEVQGVKDVWDLIDADDAAVMPIYYDGTSTRLWVELKLAYSDNDAALTSAIVQSGTLSGLKQFKSDKVGIAIVNIKGSDFVVIVGNVPVA